MAIAAGRKVLVVEDDDGMRLALERLLRAAGYDTASCASAEAALVAGVVAGAMCVVADVKLPAMSGLGLLEELNRRGRHPPVILMSAHDHARVRAEAGGGGAAGYLAKPFDGTALLAAVTAAIDAECGSKTSNGGAT